MQRDLFVKGRSLGGSSDLTLLATLKPGFAESLESVTYKTRTKRVLDVLHAARAASHEHAAAQLLSDSVERVGAIHSVRVVVLEPDDKVLLAVTFDGPWEAYIRVLWEKVGPLLDLIFCGTVDYVTAHDHTFEEWLQWARRVQVETGFFYGPPGSSARDVLFHRRTERTRARGRRWGTDPEELNELRSVLPSAEDAADRLTSGNPSPDPDEVTPGVPRNLLVYERFRNGFQAMAALYRLTDLFRPATADGTVLRMASLNLLREFVDMYKSGLEKDQFLDARKKPDGSPGRFKREMDWLFPLGQPVPGERPKSPFEKYPPASQEIVEEVQGGILHPYQGTTHGVVLLMAFGHPGAASHFLHLMQAEVTPYEPGKGCVLFRNVAFTPAGLRACGVSESDLALFPEEFRQGMAERAGVLGDVRNNHPRRWRLPNRLDTQGAPTEAPVDLSAVHAVLQLRCIDKRPEGEDAHDPADPRHPLHAEVNRWLGMHGNGISVIGMQALKRRFENNQATEHFGYADGHSEPEFGPTVSDRHRMYLGDVILGHNNPADVPPTGTGASDEYKRRMEWMRNGSFLVVRKYRQFPDRLHAHVKAAAEQMAGNSGQPLEPYIEEAYAKLMGRYRDGRPLAVPDTPGSLNDFTFDADANGKLCPLHAHVRRANPRAPADTMARPPRIIRRSMPYGYFDPADPDGSDCGLLFMAYNASLSEQFEVVQRWLAGGNATGASSGVSCPIVGVPENGVERHFRFEFERRAVNVALEDRTPMFEEPLAATRLEWGLYLFAPSRPALRRLLAAALVAGTRHPAAADVAWDVAAGRAQIAALRKIEQEKGPAIARAAWKEAIEDMDSVDRQRNGALWAAIREDHGGLLHTPYGVLVASRELLNRVLLDADERYSISGQMARMEHSIGKIYLGMDDGPEYRKQSGDVNKALMKLTAAQGFDLAFKAANLKMDAIRDEAIEKAGLGGALHYDVAIDAREIVDEVLAALSDAWFGLEGSPHFTRGSADWDWKDEHPAIYPGHFIALSRYMFQPHPGAVPQELARRYGQALQRSMKRFVEDLRDQLAKDPSFPLAPVTDAVFGSPYGKDDEYAARTMAGVIMGFTPPITGALLNLLREWARDGRFWRLRAEAAVRPASTSTYASASKLVFADLREGTGMRPMPQIIWRTARKAHRLGPAGTNAVDVDVGDILVLGLVSGTQQSLADGTGDSDRLMFGGVRSLTAPHPTHACPGYEAGMGAMVGTIAAMLSRPEKLRQGAGPFAYEMRGDVPVEEELREAARTFALRAKTRLAGEGPFGHPGTIRHMSVRSVLRAPKGLILAWGDSWLDFAQPLDDQNTDLVNCLTDLGYQVNDNLVDGDPYCNWKDWLELSTMAESIRNDDLKASFLAFVRSRLGQKPRAVLLSGGGNDSVRTPLFNMLNEKGKAATVVNVPALKRHVAGLLDHYKLIVDGINRVCAKAKVAPLPVLVHGYDNPLPFFKNFGIVPYNLVQYPWLQKPFVERKYTDKNNPKRADVAAGAAAMAEIMEELNRMLREDLPRLFPNVHYVKLTGTLQAYWKDQKEIGWSDNMHPNTMGFQALAAKVAAAIESVAPQPVAPAAVQAAAAADPGPEVVAPPGPQG